MRPPLWAKLSQYSHTICYTPIWTLLNGLLTPVWRNASPQPITMLTEGLSLKAIFKEWQYEHAWWMTQFIKARLAPSPRVVLVSICKCLALRFLSMEVKLIKVLYQALDWGISPVQCNLTWQQTNDLAHCRSSTALVEFITQAEYRHAYQKEGAARFTVADALHHVYWRFFLLITQMQIKRHPSRVPPPSPGN